MSDGMVLILLALAVAAVPFVLQLVLCLKCTSVVGKFWPFLLVVPIWGLCVLDSVNVVCLPQTYYLFGSDFHDAGTIAILGFPVLAGHLLGWGTAAAAKRVWKWKKGKKSA